MLHFVSSFNILSILFRVMSAGREKCDCLLLFLLSAFWHKKAMFTHSAPPLILQQFSTTSSPSSQALPQHCIRHEHRRYQFETFNWFMIFFLLFSTCSLWLAREMEKKDVGYTKSREDCRTFGLRSSFWEKEREFNIKLILLLSFINLTTHMRMRWANIRPCWNYCQHGFIFVSSRNAETGASSCTSERFLRKTFVSSSHVRFHMLKRI